MPGPIILPLPIPSLDEVRQFDNGVISINGLAKRLNDIYILLSRHINIGPVGEPVFNPFAVEELFGLLLGESLEGLLPARLIALLRVSPLAFIVAILEEFDGISVSAILDLLLQALPNKLSEPQRTQFFKRLREILAIVYVLMTSARLSQTKTRRVYKTRLAREAPLTPRGQ